MGIEIGQYRASIGGFHFVFCSFMTRRAANAKERLMKTLRLRGVWDAVIIGCLVTYMFWGSLLAGCGDVESNPGPNPDDTNTESRPMRQTRLHSVAGGVGGGGKDRPGNAAANTSKVGAGASPLRSAPQPTLTDVMMKLTSMDNNMSTLLEDVSDIKDRLGTVREEVNELRREVNELRQENQELRDHRDALWSKVEGLDRKMDNIECRSKRNNLIFYGFDRRNDETPVSCEERLNELFTDTLELAESVPFDRVHRLGDKADAPLIARCTFYKDKVKILKAKSKLKGTNLYIGEDFTENVRAVRKKLTVIMKEKKREGKQVSMVYDHLIINGKKCVLNEDGVSVSEVKARVKGK